MSNIPPKGRYAPPDVERLLQEEQVRWGRRPYAFLREIPSSVDAPLSYYRFRSGVTFFMRIMVVREAGDRVYLKLTAEEQPGCLGLRKQPPPREAEFVVARSEK